MSNIRPSSFQQDRYILNQKASHRNEKINGRLHGRNQTVVTENYGFENQEIKKTEYLKIFRLARLQCNIPNPVYPIKHVVTNLGFSMGFL